MRALLVPSPGVAEVVEVERPVAGPGEALVAVERVGICGTDAELFAGTMAYLDQGLTTFPLRLGHEWSGTVAQVGDPESEVLLGARVAGDPMIGCGSCRRCARGRQHLCARRVELGVRNGPAGALAEYVVVPTSSLHRLPDHLDATTGALVEPGGNALRAARAAAAGAERVLVVGPGAIGVLAAMFVRAAGVEVHLLGQRPDDLVFARSLGFDLAWTRDELPDLPFDGIVDATNSATVPAFAAELVEPGGRVAYIGLAGEPSALDTRVLALKDVTAVGVLSASPGFAETVESYASGRVDPRPLVAATVGLDDAGAVLAGDRPSDAGPGPKIHVDPRG